MVSAQLISNSFYRWSEACKCSFVCLFAFFVFVLVGKRR